MRTPLLLLVAAALIAGLVACGDDPAPVPSPSPVPAFIGPPRSLQITGDLSTATVGQTRQFTASATFANGKSYDVTSQAEWRSSNPGVASVSRGLVRVVGAGETEIIASYRNVTSASAAVKAKAISALTSISIAGPTEMTPGSAAQFTATGHYADESTQDITSIVRWGSEDVGTLRQTGVGRFEAVRAGETRVTASVTNRFTSTLVLILPAGTFKLSGIIRDSSGALEGVDVEVVSGTASSLKTKSRYDGRYALYGVSGEVRLRITARGYDVEDVTATVTGHTVRDVSLKTSSPIVDIAGEWKLTISTSSACSNSWPAAARRREVPSTITRDGTRFNINFSGPTVVATYPDQGLIAGSAFSMTLDFDYYYYYGVSGLLERLSPTEWLRITGTFEGTADASLITGNLSGSFNYFITNATATLPSGAPRSCAADGPFELRRQ
jgi:Big-like domain-containing protein